MDWPWKKKAKPPVPSSTEPWTGDHADAAQIDFYVSGTEPIDRAQFLLLDQQVQGLVSAFFQMAKDAVATRNRHGLLKAWRFAQQHVASRAETNKLAFMSVPDHQRAMADQGAVFLKEAAALFSPKSLIMVNGQQVISTRHGGGLWYLGQMTLVVLNPVHKTREIQTESGGGKKVTVKKTVVTIDPGLFDDFIKLTPDGIVISNPDLGSDEFLVPWSQADTLIISTNATMLVDPVNSYIRPMFKGLAQSQWIPFGTITIKDRQSGNMLVTALMMHPDKFKDKLQTLIKKMKPHSVSPNRVDPVAPIDLEMFMGALPSGVREDIMDMMGMDGRAKQHRFKHTLGTRMFTFRGAEYADEDTMRAEIEKAMKAIIREVDPNIRRERLQALKDLAEKVKPFAGTLLKKVLDRVTSMKVK